MPRPPSARRRRPAGAAHPLHRRPYRDPAPGPARRGAGPGRVLRDPHGPATEPHPADGGLSADVRPAGRSARLAGPALAERPEARPLRAPHHRTARLDAGLARTLRTAGLRPRRRTAGPTP